MIKSGKCPTCSNYVEDNFHFCPYCGEALTDTAKEVVRKQSTIAQLRLINLLIEKVQDKKTLELLEKLTTMYKN